MPSLQILEQIIAELLEDFSELTSTDVYLSPTVIEVPGRRKLNLQICDGGVEYSDFEGGERNENFSVVIGILTVHKIDSAERFHHTLTDEARAMHVVKDQVIATLEGSFLELLGTELLIRPLRITRESSVEEGRREKGVLIKKLIFVGGSIHER